MRFLVYSLLVISVFTFFGCNAPQVPSEGVAATASNLSATLDEEAGTITISRQGESEPFVTQQASLDHRPYLHPIVPPDGKGLFTEYSPGHHKHQTGIYWGFTQVNGRDYFHNPEGDYWRRVSARVLAANGPRVAWQTVYDLLDENGDPILRETQTWSMEEKDGRYYMDLEWKGDAIEDITIGEYEYGGLFIRMPWTEGIKGNVMNAARQQNALAEGKRAMWLDVGMQVAGREDLAHIAVFDHPDNKGYPQPWRVDGQLGVGPVRARMGDWTINKGESEYIRHQLMFYTGEMSDMEITELWVDYTDAHDMYGVASLWGIAQQEGLEAEFLSPERAAEEMTLLDGFNVNAWAGEPMITQPMAFTWDDKGRLWVAENRDYESRGAGFSASGDSRILILEDTDRDGVADTRKVFLEGIPFPAAIAVGFDGLFLGAPPHLMFVPDKDQDDKADMEDLEILLTGWGIRDRHETINSLHWGPDGWLYGLEGFATPSRIRKPDANEKLYAHNDSFPDDIFEKEGVDIDGGVWRYHPTKDRFEVVAHGFSNPWGIDYDSKGQMFISACVIPHMFHVIPGGIYHRQGGQHFNPYVYSDIRTIVDHRHRSAHGGARVYQSDAFPEEHRGRLFMANIHEHAVLTDILEKKGSGFVAKHGDDFLLANNAQWIGFSIEIGPEGGVYVLDWHDADICGKDVHDKDTGRIFRIMPDESMAEDWPGRYEDLRERTDLELVQLQESPSDWHARRARVILQHRAHERGIDQEAADALLSLHTVEGDDDIRLRAMWTLHVTGLMDVDLLAESLDDTDEYVRSWAIQFLTEDDPPSGEILATFAQMAENDRSPVVRKYLASALQRIDLADRWLIAEHLAEREEDAEDHNIPKMLWFGVEPLVAEDPERAFAIAGNGQIPLVTEHIARRAVDGDLIEPLFAALESYPSAREGLLTGMRSGLEGRSDLQTPANWASVYETLKSDRRVSDLALDVAQLFGDSEAAKELLASLTRSDASADQKRSAINGLAAKQREELVDHLPALLESDDVRLDAIKAVAAYDVPALGEQLLSQFASLNQDEKNEAILTLASRSSYGWMLTEALKDGSMAKADVPAYVARQMRRVVGNGFVEVWGPIDQLSVDKAAEYARYEALLTDQAVASADAVNGQAVFQQTCGACHVMYEEGGNIGPDLTGSNRDNLDYILSNMLSPSEVIQDDYKMVIITTRDGRTYLGNITAENDRQLTLRTVGEDGLVINKSDIQTREVSNSSLMPEGLLQNLSDEAVLDLVAFLRTSEPVLAAR